MAPKLFNGVKVTDFHSALLLLPLRLLALLLDLSLAVLIVCSQFFSTQFIVGVICVV